MNFILVLKKLLQYYQIFCNLSLDVVLGVICCMLPLPLCFDVHVNLGWYIGLPAATWLIYLSDHVLDTLRNAQPISERHDFVRTYFKHILALMLMLLIGCVYLAFIYYNVVLILTAFTIVFFCLLYFILTSIKNEAFQYFYNKELMVACIYATALYLAIGLSAHSFSNWLLFYVVMMLITYLNLLMISIVELPEDKANHQFSWVVMIGKQRATVLFNLLSLSTILVCIWLVIQSHGALDVLAICYLAMNIAHWFLFRYLQKHPTARIDYRKWSEVIFWIPILAYILA